MIPGKRTNSSLETRKKDIYAVLVILLLPILITLPCLLGFWNVDPIYFISGLTSRFTQTFPLLPWIDPNAGTTSQALGKLSADEWLSGRIPWWNYYSGVGLPLAAEMQPASLFLPFVLLNHFSNGVFYMKVILQILAGVGTYFLLRKIELTPLPAITGALVYAFNGAFAWHSSPNVNPIAFLPWLIFGIECAREKSLTGFAGGSSIIACSLAFSIYAGFPEIAYIDGLFAGVWALWRLCTMAAENRYQFIQKLVIGVVAGLLLSMPAIIPFIEFCRYSYLGDHNANAGYSGSWLRVEALPQLFFPWLYGSIWSYMDPSKVAFAVWANVGGFLSAAQLSIIALGLFATRKSSLYIILLVWILVSLGRTFGLPLVSSAVDFIPLLKITNFCRYSPPSWQFCSAVMCALVINNIGSGRLPSGKKFILALLLAFSVVAISLYPAWSLVKDFWLQRGYRTFFWASLSWGFGSMAIAAICFKLARYHHRTAGRAMAGLLAVDAIALFSIPLFSGLTSASFSLDGVQYLKEHLGTGRFYTLGPIGPNYGAYFRIASINNMYLPVAQNWVDYIKARLDPYVNPLFFTGNCPRTDPNAQSQAVVLRDRLAEYEETGVRYVVTPHKENPFQGISSLKDDPQLVFQSSLMDIYELSRTKPYFDVIQGRADLHGENRSVVTVDSASKAQMIRRELYFPGWKAYTGGHFLKVERYHQTFQSLKVPPGKYKITFTYTPTNSGVILTLFLLGVLLLIIDAVLSRRKLTPGGIFRVARWLTAFR